MSDVFISYAKHDRPVAERLANLLEEKGWSVWWDTQILVGQSFEEAIREALDSAGCVIVLWSNKSIDSDWVKEEADDARRRKILVPALIEDVKIPLGFGRVQTANLSGWDGKAENANLQDLLNGVSTILSGTGRPQKRSRKRAVKHKRMTAEGNRAQAAREWAVYVHKSAERGLRTLEVILTHERHKVEYKYDLLGHGDVVKIDDEIVSKSSWDPSNDIVHRFDITDGRARYDAQLKIHRPFGMISAVHLIISDHTVYKWSMVRDGGVF